MGLPAGQFHVGVHPLRSVDDAHPATAAPGRSLHQQREPPALSELSGRRIARQALCRTRHHGHAGALGNVLRAELVPELRHAFRSGADERDPGFVARPGERRVFRQEPVARVYGIGAAVSGGLNYFVDVQVGFFRRVPGQGYRLFRGQHVGSAGVRVRIHRHGGNLHGAEGLVNPDRDFAPIGHQHFGEHQRASDESRRTSEILPAEPLFQFADAGFSSGGAGFGGEAGFPFIF